MKDQSFQFRFTSSKKPPELFNYLIHPQNWWVGLFGETIEGKSELLQDEFTFSAGDGVHFSKQRLVEVNPGKKIVWKVTESNLSFLQNTGEWEGTSICFTIMQQNEQTIITFTHEGLVPHIECYGSCSGAWTQYLQKLKQNLE